MKILLIAPHPFFQHRGTPIAVRLVATVLSEMGHEITLLTLPEGEDVSIPGCKIVRIPRVPGVSGVRPGFSWKKGIYDLLLLCQVSRMLKKTVFDLVHAVEEAAFMGIYAKRCRGIPFVYDMDSSLSEQLVEKYPGLDFFSPAFRFFEKALIRESMGVLPVCRALETKAKQVDPQKPIQRLEDISLLDLEGVFQETGETGGFGGKPVVMYIGNLEKYQGIDLLIQGFKIASSAFPDARLVIVGGIDDDIARYHEICARQEISQKAVFLGPRPIFELKRLFAFADILVSPRVSGNNTPMKIYSYLDSGKPVLATDLPTHTQVLDDEIALLVKPDPKALGKGLIRLMTDEGLRKRLVNNASRRVEEQYSLAAFRRKLATFYKKLENQIAAEGKTS